MLIGTLNLEAQALRAFREDSETESELEEEPQISETVQAEGGGQEIELAGSGGRTVGNRQQARPKQDRSATRLQYLGGEKERGGKRKNKKEQGCFEKLLRMSESRNSQFGGSGANQDFK